MGCNASKAVAPANHGTTAPHGTAAESRASQASTAESRVARQLQQKQLAMSVEHKLRVRRQEMTAGESYDETAKQSMGSTHQHPSIPKSDQARAIIMRALAKNFLFASVEAEEMNIVVNAMEKVNMRKGEAAITQGDPGDRFYVVEKGCFDFVVDEQKVGEVSEGGSFGELALMYECPRNASVIATCDGSLWALDRGTFRSVIVSSAARTLQETKQFLRRVELLQRLDERQLSKIAEAMQRVEFKENDIIIRQNDVSANIFYIIKSGSVEVSKHDDDIDTDVRFLELSSGQWFGEQALLSSQPRAATVKAKGPVVCMALHREMFLKLLGPFESMMKAQHSERQLLEHKMREQLVRQFSNNQDEAERAKLPDSMPAPGGGQLVKVKHSFRSIRGDLTLDTLEMRAVLGEGAFGLVRLVRHKPTGEVYALKQMQKARIVRTGQQRNVLNEKKIMMQLNHPYVIELIKTFKDRDCLYMLLEFLQGGDMFGLLSRQGGTFTTDVARYYAAIVTSVLEYLHSMQVAYRDLKPENLVLDNSGYLQVVDFGFAKKVRDRTFTLCGTPEYLAPELIQGKGHHQGVDWWALGILIYEMLVGYSPFADHDGNRQVAIYKNILAGEIRFPSRMKDKVAKDLIRRLLTQSMSKRLGCQRRGADDVKHHDWFEGEMDWDALYRKEIPPPIVPKLRSATDTSAFEDIQPESKKIQRYEPDPHAAPWDEEF